MSLLQSIEDRLRASPLLLLCLPLIVWVLMQAPVKGGVFVYGIAKLFAFGFAGYWIDRLVYRRTDRPHLQLCSEERHAAWYRRAVIVAACIIVSGLTP